MEPHKFKPKARLLIQLGEQLIKNEGIALLELIKNSYDADAKKVEVSLKNIDSKDGEIVVKDYGNGMDIKIIEDVWLEPGTEFKTLEENKLSPVLKRRVLGKKGIGRFAAHKLGDSIELITRKKDCNEVHLEIDWTKLKETEYLEEFPISISERTPEVFTGDISGTQITIKNFRKPWTKFQLREAYRSWISLCSPFDSPESFDIEYSIDKGEWLEGLITVKEVKDSALFYFICDIEGSKISKLTYKFLPWKSMGEKIIGREITENDPQLKTQLELQKWDEEKKCVIPLDLNAHAIGPIRIEGLIFDRDSRILSLGIEDKKGFKEYLNENGGMKIYRDGIRVFDYGEKSNDWLRLDQKRINTPAETISNNLILGSVQLKVGQSDDLEEKANREGFIENEAYHDFVSAIEYVIMRIEQLRNPDKDRLRAVYGPTRMSEPVIYSIDDLTETVSKELPDEKLKNKILKKLAKIKSQYVHVNEILLKSSSSGLVFNTVVHQVEKIVKELKAAIILNKIDGKNMRLIDNLGKVIDGYIFLIKKSSIKNNSLKKLIDYAFDSTDRRFVKHEIEAVKKYKEFSQNDIVSCYDGMTVTSLINILDNSIYWVDQKGETNKKAYVAISEEMDGFLSIIIADNGTGFTNISPEQMTAPYVSTKSFGTGLGLHLAKEVMESQHGQIRFPAWGEFTIPKVFKDGAVVALCFKLSDQK